jgi:hypothetical protein
MTACGPDSLARFEAFPALVTQDTPAYCSYERESATIKISIGSPHFPTNKKPAPITRGGLEIRVSDSVTRLLRFCGSGGGSGSFEFLDALDAGSFAAQSAQVAQLRAADAALAYHLD